MLARIICWSLDNRLLVALAALALAAIGTVSMLRTPVDAIPDLSDTQVILRSSLPGATPQIIDDQLTWPLSTAMLSVPGAHSVRGFSYFGDSFVYILFEDDVDLYWARSRVAEALAQVRGRLPDDAEVQLGPDATGVGWVYQYALVDRSGEHDIAELRALQDWFLRFELEALDGVAEVATLGGQIRGYEIQLDPDALSRFGLRPAEIAAAVRAHNAESGAGIIEVAEAEVMLRASGYLQRLEDLRNVPLRLAPDGTPLLLGDIANVQRAPLPRRGIAELDGEGEVTGAIVVMRSGANALETVRRVRQRLQALGGSLPEGVEIVTTYDRTALIGRAVDTLRHRLVEEMAIVVVVCALFLFHLRSALVILLFLPLGLLGAFALMRAQGLHADIMSLGGIAIAIGAMVDAAVVMVENAHRHLAADDHRPRQQRIRDAAVEVGPALFYSLLIITISFLPVFALQAQEGRLFSPLAYTKTWAMAVAAGLSITLVPVLMLWLLRGRIRPEGDNPLVRGLVAAYLPLLRAALRAPWTVIALAVALTLATLWPLSRLGTEFMPAMDEGDILYMPSALPGLAPDKAAELLQQTDRILKSFPEVHRVFGKAGRAETATDPAPLPMFETLVQFEPRDSWRPGLTREALIAEMDAALSIPGLSNVWVEPIRNRIDMQVTGVRAAVGLRLTGESLETLESVATEAERLLRDLPGVRSAVAERPSQGRYLDIRIDRRRAAREGLSIAEIHDSLRLAVGGSVIDETLEGRARFPVFLRYGQTRRDHLQALRALPLRTPDGRQTTLGSVAELAYAAGPGGIKSENGRPAVLVNIDVTGRDLGGFVAEARQALDDGLALPPRVSLAFVGQYQYLERAAASMQLIVPMTLLAIFVLLYLTFRRWQEALLLMATLPMAGVGGVWLLWALDHDLSVASAVGFIALAGLAAEFGVIMLLYLHQALTQAQARTAASAPVAGGGRTHHPAQPEAGLDADALHAAIVDGAALRVRPKAMTALTIIFGLLPTLLVGGTGSEAMQRIAAPMVGGMISAPLLSLFVLPAAYALLLGSRLKGRSATEPDQ